jgi:uncharacterized protein (DUF1330 family)
MPYALNLFNLIPGKEDQYRSYSVLAGKIIYRLGGRVIAAGQTPLRHLHGAIERRQMIVVEFPSESAFQQFFDEAQREGIHELREGATTDYIWTLYERWDVRAWVAQSNARVSGESHEVSTARHETPADVEKQPLVLLPGLLCDQALWVPQIDSLSDTCETTRSRGWQRASWRRCRMSALPWRPCPWAVTWLWRSCVRRRSG